MLQKLREATAEETFEEEKSVVVKEKYNRKSKQKSLKQSSSSLVLESHSKPAVSDSASCCQSHDPLDSKPQQKTRTNQIKRQNQADDIGDSYSNHKRAKWASNAAGPSNDRGGGKRKEDGGEKKLRRSHRHSTCFFSF